MEYGFLDSTLDDVNQLKNDSEKYAEAVVKALAEYTNTNYNGTSDNVYVVKKGDSLWSIAKKLGVTVNELKEANRLTSNLLSIGQKLVIPTKENQNQSSGNYYTVKSGDSLYAIARKYNTTVNEIKNLNNLTSINLSIGQKLLIPTNTKESNQTYTVKAGDNLYSIARRYNVSQQDLMDLNNLTSNLLSIGQILQIPSTNQTTYIVKSGDSLYAIARRFNTSVNDIKTKNDLISNTLSIGQKLVI